ncbi:MAG: DNA translocase FtsK 4TM domain-containing protein, partial [Wenzhouxiangellaceae bacterium]
MARSARKSSNSQFPEKLERRLFESLFLLVTVISVYLLITLVTHDARDPGFSSSGGSVVNNLGGSFGAWVSDFLLVVVGYMAWFIPVLLGAAGVKLLQERSEPVGLPEWGVRLGGLLLILLSGCILFEMQPRGSLEHTGGIIGDLLSAPMIQVMGFTGAALINLAVLLAGITLFTGISWIHVVDRVGAWAITAWGWTGEKLAEGRDWMAGRRARAEREVVRKR